MPRKNQFTSSVEFECPICKKIFRRYKSFVKYNPKTIFCCSYKCANQKKSYVQNDNELVKKIIDDYNKGLGTSKLQTKYNVSHDTIKKILISNNIKIRTVYDYKGNLNPNYKGGYITSQGYRRINGAFEHRTIIENFLGRKLQKNEHVHHLNGNKLDNRLENLSVLTHKKHSTLHAKEYNDWRKMYQVRIEELEKQIEQLTNEKNPSICITRPLLSHPSQNNN